MSNLRYMDYIIAYIFDLNMLILHPKSSILYQKKLLRNKGSLFSLFILLLSVQVPQIHHPSSFAAFRLLS